MGFSTSVKRGSKMLRSGVEAGLFVTLLATLSIVTTAAQGYQRSEMLSMRPERHRKQDPTPPNRAFTLPTIIDSRNSHLCDIAVGDKFLMKMPSQRSIREDDKDTMTCGVVASVTADVFGRKE
ncbi:hypothetical protein Bbelb_009170 [Branchiostoma belcheri]|nr:hypothetical protein Bbelb_009170 [Branchiostoma belcheri]